jgi:uncharacterized protein (TIGR00369 family)
MRGMEQTDDRAAEIEFLNDAMEGVPLHAQMGLRVHELGARTTLTMELSESMRGGVEGSIHGGMLATFADAASAMALMGSFDPDSQAPVTTDMHIRYYRQPRGGPLTANVTVVHQGRRLLSCECVVEDAESRVLARSTATYMVVPRQ